MNKKNDDLHIIKIYSVNSTNDKYGFRLFSNSVILDADIILKIFPIGINIYLYNTNGIILGCKRCSGNKLLETNNISFAYI